VIRCKLAATAIIGLGVVGCTTTAETPAPAPSATPAAASPAVPQAPQERVFSFRSNATFSGCPSLDWHVVVQPDYTVSGMVGWQNMQVVARVSGTMDAQSKTYQLTAKEVNGKRTATINGTIISPDHITANIKGPGVDCQGLDVWAYTPQRGPIGGGSGRS
jgi:hypothetical protein